MERSSVIFAIPSSYLHHQYAQQHPHPRAKSGTRKPSPSNAGEMPYHHTTSPKYAADVPQSQDAQMAATHAWLADQERAAIEKRNRATRRWVEQQQRSSTSHSAHPVHPQTTTESATHPHVASQTHPANQPHVLHHTCTTVQPPRPATTAGLHAQTVIHPHIPNQPDEKKRSRTRDRDPEEEREHRERRLELQQEFKRMEARWREREMQEAKGRREREMQDERRKAEWKREEEKRAKDKERNFGAEEMKRLDAQRMRGAWAIYERRWAALLLGGGEPLTFWNIPWPVLHPPRSVRDITPEAVATFILSGLHSEGIPRRERVRDALRRWHPDRFGRLIPRITPDDWAVVEYGVGVVVRCLNGLLESENFVVNGNKR